MPPYRSRMLRPYLAFTLPGFWVTQVIAPDTSMDPAPPRRHNPRLRAVPSPPHHWQQLHSLRWSGTSLPHRSWVPSPNPMATAYSTAGLCALYSTGANEPSRWH